MKVIWNNQVIAEAPKEALIYIEGNWYFPPDSVKMELFELSTTPYTCPWKGVCQFYHIVDGDKRSEDNAWAYPEPKESAIKMVKKDFSGYVAFYKDRDVTIEE